MYKYSPVLKSHILAAAEMPCLMSVILGPIKQLDCLTLVRGIHNTRYKSPNVYESVLNPEWCNSYHLVHESLIDELAQTDNITVEQAKEIVKIVMKKRFMGGVQKRMAQKKNENEKHTFIHISINLLNFYYSCSKCGKESKNQENYSGIIQRKKDCRNATRFCV